MNPVPDTTTDSTGGILMKPIAFEDDDTRVEEGTMFIIHKRAFKIDDQRPFYLQFYQDGHHYEVGLIRKKSPTGVDQYFITRAQMLPQPPPSATEVQMNFKISLSPVSAEK